VTFARSFVVAASLLALASCKRAPPNGSPDGAVRDFVERLDRAASDPGDVHAIFDVLSRRARDNLTERSRRYAAATGKTMSPDSMMVPSRFMLRFTPERYTAKISGPFALVEVAGVGRDDRAELPCVFEDGAWRVDLALPEPPAARTRPDAGL
jgi:hypothetical protein